MVIILFMTIEEYIVRKNLTQRDFASIVGVSQPAVHAWINGKKHPAPWHARKIVEVTQGQVTFEDLYKHQPKGEAA